MRRREFIALLATSAIPCAGHGQERLPLIGFLNSAAAAESFHFVAAFREGLSEVGLAEGRDVTVRYSWAEGNYERLPAMATQLVNEGLAVLVATGGGPAGLAAKAASATVPIVSIGTNPVGLGLVAAYNRPGGNVTGIDLFSTALGPKRLEILREAVPMAKMVSLLVNPANPSTVTQIDQLQRAAREMGLRIDVVNARNEDELRSAFRLLMQQQIDALVVGTDPFFNSRRKLIVDLAAQHSVPAIYQWREFVEAGGLMSYATSISDVYKQAGTYAGRILKGESPSEMPVLQPTRFELIINLRTAKELGLTIPPTILARADEVIE
jgi:putative ABC transport system substrate-binding protein